VYNENDKDFQNSLPEISLDLFIVISKKIKL